MKVIDILNKIANGEEVPLIKIYGRTLRYNKEEHWFDDIDDESYCRYKFDFEEFNDEVEIIDEDKPVIEKEELENRIENALEFLETQYNTFPSGEMWREALKNTLQGKDYDDVYAKDKKIEKLDEYDYNSANEIIIRRKINEIIDYINREK